MMLFQVALGTILAFGPPKSGKESAPDSDMEIVIDEPAPAKEELVGPAYQEELEPLPEKQQQRKKAEGLFNDASAAFAEARYLEAIEFFAEAYRTYPRGANILYSLGQSHRLQYETTGDERHVQFAIFRYSQYLREQPEGEFATQASQHVSALLALTFGKGVEEKKLVTRVMVRTTAQDAWMTVDGGEPMPAPSVEVVEPGEHTVVVGGTGYVESTQTVDVPEGATLQLSYDLDPLPTRVSVTGPRGAEVAVDGRKIGKLPLSKPVEVEPGIHFIAVTRNGHVAYTRQFEVGRDEDLAIDAEMRNSTQRVMSYTLLGLGGAGVVTSGVMMGLAFAAQERAIAHDETIDMGDAPVEVNTALGEEIARRNQFRTISIASGAVGAGLLLTGVVLFVFDRPQVDVPLFDRERRANPSEPGPSLSAAPILSPDMVGATAAMRF